MTTKSIHEFDALMEALDIDVNKLGCVMLPVEPFDIFGEGRDALLNTEDLYASNDPAKFWVAGDVSEKAHITLLYGLMEPPHKSNIMKNAVDTVLADWDRPEFLAPEEISFFPSPFKDEPNYAAVVVKLDDPHLDEAHARLSYLPHVNTFAVYQQHMTLCYVKLEAAQRWMDVLNEAQFHLYVKEGLDYGEER